jgi:hypothetical protein
VKEVLLAKLRLLCERVLVQSLAILKLLAGEEMDLPLLKLGFLSGQQGIEPLEGLKSLVGWKSSSLVRLVSLSEQGVIEFLMKMKYPLEQVAQLFVDLHVEEQGYPRDDLPVFLLQVPD